MAAPSLTPAACDVDELFRLFTLPVSQLTAQYLLLDTRDYNKAFKRGHIAQSFCVRLSANGRALLDYRCELDQIWIVRLIWAQGACNARQQLTVQCCARG
jgi:hypothetical protein